MLETEGKSLDPADWTAFRAQAHKMLDDMLDYTQGLNARAVWQPMPAEVQTHLRGSLTEKTLGDAHVDFMQNILPYAVGNTHPRFMGWVHGGGTPVGMVAEMLAAGLNANLGGRNQAPVEIERQVMRWVRDLFGFPETASGLFVTGTSMANLIGCLCAKSQANDAENLTAYTSTAAHISVAQSLDICGIGKNALQKIPVNENYEMDVLALEQAIISDKKAGKTPFLVVATIGTVDVGAIDDLQKVAAICEREKVWFHIDGAFGALAMLSPELAPRLKGIELADSIAFDFHKWGQVPYDAGFILVRDSEIHQKTFASPAAYLQRQERGLSANSPWACDLGLDLSRSFRALKTWFTLSVYGNEKLGQVIAHTCELAQLLKRNIENSPELELLAPVALNIVCFRYRCDDANRVNTEIVIALQESGIAAPSSTTLNGNVAIRAAIVNHRTTENDIAILLEAVLKFGNVLTTSTP
ncbi:MAG: aminotransferase class V-fold PLP-dependent enzyme [Methylococcales bacterium]|nr:aminotransferase class V-fold PLP-dependent enzyme [Methylococcales bacterium]